MGFIGDLLDPGNFTGSGSDSATLGRINDPLDFSGNAAARANDAAGRAEQDANARAIAAERGGRAGAQGFLEPFAAVGQRGAELSGFLANPEAQFDFLQNNPIFDMSLENANRETNARAASKGRLSAGDTLSELSNNVLLAANPLINAQRQDIGNLLNLGTGIATTQANVSIGEGSNVSNLLGNVGNIEASRIIGNQQARQQGAQSAAQIAGSLFGFSDSRLKDDAEMTGITENGYDVWKWNWNALAKELFGLEGSDHGVMFSDVAKNDPSLVTYQDGYGKVNYESLGVSHGAS